MPLAWGGSLPPQSAPAPNCSNPARPCCSTCITPLSLPRWFRWLWHLSNAARLLIRRLPPRPKQFVTDLIALTVYWPLSRLASLAEAAGLPVASFPLSYYRRCSFYTMRTDARDRFGTPLEQRFSRAQIRTMCTAAGLVDLRFSPRAPYWSVVGVKSCCNTSSFT